MQGKKLEPKKLIKKPKPFDPKLFLRDFMAFSDKINDDFVCAICYNLLYKPTILPCNHRFCVSCLEKWSNREKEGFQCPLCQREYPLSTKISLNTDLERNIKEEYKQEYDLLAKYKKWEFDSREFNEIKCFYGNSFANTAEKRVWTFFFRFKEGVKNDFIDKIVVKINANSLGMGGQTVELTKYPFVYRYTVNNQNQSVFSLLIYVHWKKRLNLAVTRLSYDVVMSPEGKTLSYLFKEHIKKKKK